MALVELLLSEVLVEIVEPHNHRNEGEKLKVAGEEAEGNHYLTRRGKLRRVRSD